MLTQKQLAALRVGDLLRINEGVTPTMRDAGVRTGDTGWVVGIEDPPSARKGMSGLRLRFVTARSSMHKTGGWLFFAGEVDWVGEPS